jgi:hypothetical protein
MVPSARIGVLTFHRCINYGSYWQARCLVEGLSRRGFDAVLLDHHSRKVNAAEWRCALQPVPGADGSDRQLYRAKARRFFEAFDALPLSRSFALERPQDMEPVDLTIVGSDEVWNLKHPWYGGAAAFYGSGLRTGRLASYAASFGNHSFMDGLDSEWADYLRSFSHISIRDENSLRLVETALDREPYLVLDPCLQFPEAIHVDRRDIGRPYIGVYGHSFPRWFAEGIRHHADAEGLAVISIGYRVDWADESWIEAGPEDFPGFIAGASGMATNFFHGCVFSLLTGRPFATVLSDYRSNKIRDLTAMLGAERHIATEETTATDYSTLLSAAPEPNIARRIDQLRGHSSGYLDDVLH